jgi:hypothetical protein
MLARTGVTRAQATQCLQNRVVAVMICLQELASHGGMLEECGYTVAQFAQARPRKNSLAGSSTSRLEAHAQLVYPLLLLPFLLLLLLLLLLQTVRL